MDGVTVSVEASFTVEPEQTPLFARTIVNRTLPDGVVVYASGTIEPAIFAGLLPPGIWLNPTAVKNVPAPRLPI
jgi:hypothetical protein